MQGESLTLSAWTLRDGFLFLVGLVKLLFEPPDEGAVLAIGSSLFGGDGVVGREREEYAFLFHDIMFLFLEYYKIARITITEKHNLIY